ncbi:NitT/TauT family transport system substrate-binding protein [Fontibacillus phaseoli]|uniref:NitT/TauT family transport system substrate-binding protein n=1 Tax=Fontibacillus phaseoli TaxID=1416533 RepID=A0A369BFQ2_9BACL|nr:ABC transporter substrate-binding protein [Fontibacillus phaseoli]RCX20373.1 NitT/TauT family transport system substrate-binding protein [Fontibacillus phaseoli]
MPVSKRNNTHLKRTGISSLLFVLTFLIVLTGCGSSGDETSSKAQAAGNSGGENGQQTKVKLNIADISSNPVLRVAVNQGLFEKHGIDAKLVTFATPAEGINSLFIKQADVAWGADFPILNAVSKGEFAIIASTGTSTDLSAQQWKLFVRDDIKRPEDLKGKNLSFMRGTFITYLWDEYLSEYGLKPDDAKLIGQGGFDEAYIALKKGEVDAVWATGAVMVEKFAAIEGVHQLTDMSQTKVRIGSQIVAPESLIKEHPEAVSGFLSALDESSAFIKENPEKVADILYKEVKQPREATLKDLSVVNWNIDFDQAALDSLSRQKKYMVENGIIQQDFELEDKIKLDALREILPDRVTITP